MMKKRNSHKASPKQINGREILASGRRVLAMEARAIGELQARLNNDFVKAVKLILTSRGKGRVIVIGMGKPGFIAQKISATMSSTGTPSFYVHPAEAFHGDLGKITKDDIVLAISNSGTTEEIVKLLQPLKKIGSKIIAMTANADSPLGKVADVCLVVKVKKEACSLDLAPTSSTTAALALGDALAVALHEAIQFRPEDFAFFHPGGNLARRFVKVKDLMRQGIDSPRVGEKTPVKKTLLLITQAKAGSCSVVDTNGKLIGIFTDGDLRRHLEADNLTYVEFLKQPIRAICTLNPISVREDRLAAEALSILRERKIDELPVVDARGRAVGLLDIQDLLKAGFI